MFYVRLILFFALSLAGCDALMFRNSFEDVEPAVLYTSKSMTSAPDDLGELLIINHNIKYGGGRLLFFWECGGTRYNMSEKEVKRHLDAVVEFINELEPDILMLQEVQEHIEKDQSPRLCDGMWAAAASAPAIAEPPLKTSDVAIVNGTEPPTTPAPRSRPASPDNSPESLFRV